MWILPLWWIQCLAMWMSDSPASYRMWIQCDWNSISDCPAKCLIPLSIKCPSPCDPIWPNIPFFASDSLAKGKRHIRMIPCSTAQRNLFNQIRIWRLGVKDILHPIPACLQAFHRKFHWGQLQMKWQTTKNRKSSKLKQKSIGSWFLISWKLTWRVGGGSWRTRIASSHPTTGIKSSLKSATNCTVIIIIILLFVLILIILIIILILILIIIIIIIKQAADEPGP